MKKPKWKNYLKAGDIIRVKEGIKCPDSKDLDIGGWQGTVTEIAKDENNNVLIGIRWNSTTILNMPESFIIEGEEEGLDNDSMYLFYEDIESIK